MRRYSALWNSFSESWSVIFQDPGDESFYTYLPEAPDESTAKKIAEALNQ